MYSLFIELYILFVGGFLDPNRRISSLGRLTKGGNTSLKSPANVNNTEMPCNIKTTSSRSLHGGGPPSQTTNTTTPQSTSASIKNQLHSNIEPTSLSLSKPCVRLAYAGKYTLG